MCFSISPLYFNKSLKIYHGSSLNLSENYPLNIERIDTLYLKYTVVKFHYFTNAMHGLQGHISSSPLLTVQISMCI